MLVACCPEGLADTHEREECRGKAVRSDLDLEMCVLPDLGRVNGWEGEELPFSPPGLALIFPHVYEQMSLL